MQNIKGIAFIVSEILKQNQQEEEKYPTPLPPHPPD